MKKILIPVMSFFIVSTLVMVSCKKKDKNEDTTDPVYVPTLLCDGNGSGNYFPLQTGNKYSYGYKVKAKAQADRNYTITKDSVVGGQTYKKLQRDNAPAVYELIRTEQTTNNVYTYIPSLNKEVLLVPGTPVLDQVLEVATPGNKAKVTSVSASFQTASCNYSGLLEITEFNSGGKAIALYHYKPGVGRVHTAYAPNPTDTEDYQIKSVVLN